MWLVWRGEERQYISVEKVSIFNKINLIIMSSISTLDWLQLIPECVHVRVLKRAISNFDATYSLTPGHSEHSEEAGAHSIFVIYFLNMLFINP